ncbi:MAG: MarR family transcriptional regulator, partial [Dehalococcoidia bacterium]|nr:MarR family transcriptional regulator [Dehalococcoidia bacterium]
MVADERERRRAWQDFLFAHKVVLGDLERRMMEESGFPLTWYDILAALHLEPERRLRLQALAEHIMLSRSGLTRLVDRMAEAGLIRREPCATDRRGAYAALTPEGEAAFQRVAPDHRRRVQEHFLGLLDGEDVTALREALGKVLAAAGRPERPYDAPIEREEALAG